VGAVFLPRKHVIFDANPLSPVLDQRLELGLRSLSAHTVFQSSNEIQKVTGAVLPIGRIEGEWHPQLRAVVHEVSAWRHDADDLAPKAVHFDHLANHQSATERALP